MSRNLENVVQDVQTMAANISAEELAGPDDTKSDVRGTGVEGAYHNKPNARIHSSIKIRICLICPSVGLLYKEGIEGWQKCNGLAFDRWFFRGWLSQAI